MLIMIIEKNSYGEKNYKPLQKFFYEMKNLKKM